MLRLSLIVLGWSMCAAPAGAQRAALRPVSCNRSCRPIIAGNMAKQPAMAKFKHRVVGDLPHANRIMKQGFSIGNHQGIGPDEIGYVHDAVKEFMRLNA